MRIAPVSPPFAPKVQALFDRLPASWSPPFAIFTVLARDERLLSRFIGSSVAYLEPSHVTVRQREVLLLRLSLEPKVGRPFPAAHGKVLMARDSRTPV
jgi:hypothetical protein